MKRAVLENLLEAQAAKRPIVLAVNLATNEETLIGPDAANAPAWLVEKVRESIRSDKSRVVEAPDGTSWFLNAFNPPLRLVIVGAVHIAQPLASMAMATGYDVTIVDPRQSFATATRFPDVALHTEWPDEALAALALDARTAVVTLSHDPKIDDPALQVALQSPCFYIGALGSNKTQAARRDRLANKEFDPDSIARIHGPVGLDIGAKSPAEIAISILAEMTAVLRGVTP